MASPKHTPLALSLALLAACGPGTSTTDAGSTSDSGTTQAASTGDTPTTAPPTTTDATTDPTTASSTPTSSPTTDATTVATTDATTDATTGDPACPDVFPEEGTPCEAEGLFCGGPCEDPCSFCNIIQCEQGTWTHLEVFPAECLDCETVCALVVPAACMAGPPDMDTCVTGCQNTQAGECGLVYNIVLACIGGTPSFSCDDDGHPSVAGCEVAFGDLYDCLG